MSALRKALAEDGLRCADLSGVLISHEHADHCLSVGDLAAGNTPVWSNQDVLEALKLHGFPQASLISSVSPPCLAMSK